MKRRFVRPSRPTSRVLWRAYACAAMVMPGWVGAAAADGLAAQPDLRGIRQASLLASQLTADGAACGLNLARLDAAARARLADAGLALSEPSPVRVTISAMTSQVGAPASCASAVLIGVYSRESFFSATAGWLRTGDVVLWQRGMMVAGPAGEHAAAVAAAVRQLTDQMLAAWHAQNLPPGGAAAAMVTSAVAAGGPSPGGPVAARAGDVAARLPPPE